MDEGRWAMGVRDRYTWVFFLWLLSSKYFTWLHFSQCLQPMALVGFSGFRLDLVYPPVLHPFLWAFRSGRPPLGRIVTVMDYAKSFSLMLDLDIFSRFETFPLPASLILPLSPKPVSVALFLHLLFRLRAHFFARLPSLFAFACWQRNFGVPGYVNFCATRSAMKAATNNKLRYSDKHFNNNNNSSSTRIHNGGISPCPHDANFYNIRQRKLFSCHFCSNRNEFAETLKWFSDWTAL